MQRRRFLRGAGAIGAGAAVFAAPAVAQSMPEVKWRCASSFPRALDTVFGASEVMAKVLAEATENRFQIRVLPAGDVARPLQIAEAVQAGTVECGHTAAYYHVGKEPTLAFETAAPFGLSARQQDAWMSHGGGRQLMNELFKDINIHAITCGNTGAQMGGWFRKEIKTVDDLKGLRFAIGGLAAAVLAKLGVVPQQLAASDISAALEKGAVDAAKWAGPYDDQKLGLNKAAQHYHYPGWWEGGSQLSILVNIAKWNELPKAYQAALDNACAKAHTWMLAKYDALNPKALRELVGSGTRLAPFQPPVMEACFAAAVEFYNEMAAVNPKFKKVYDSWKAFRSDEVLWFRVGENTFDNFMARASAQNKL